MIYLYFEIHTAFLVSNQWVIVVVIIVINVVVNVVVVVVVVIAEVYKNMIPSFDASIYQNASYTINKTLSIRNSIGRIELTNKQVEMYFGSLCSEQETTSNDENCAPNTVSKKRNRTIAFFEDEE